MSIQRQQFRIQNFPTETREYNPLKCVRMFSDFFDKGNFNTNAAAGASGSTPTIGYTMLYSNTSAHYATMSSVVGSVVTARADIRDTVGVPVMKGGQAEMDICCKVKTNYAATPNTLVLVRVGFYDTSVSPVLPGSGCGVCFFINAGSTWKVGVYKGWDGVALSATSYKFEKDTGIQSADYHTLCIWQDAKATIAIFTIDDVVVHVQNGNLPNTLDTKAYNAGVGLTCTGTQVVSTVVDVDWMQFRYFADRTT